LLITFSLKQNPQRTPVNLGAMFIRYGGTMNSVEFYGIVRKYFTDNAFVANFVNPLANWAKRFPDVQFILPDGSICPPYQSMASEQIVAEPLAGPFYEKEIKGWWGFESCHLENKGCFFVGTAIQLENDEIIHSCPILIQSYVDDVLEVLKEKCDNVSYLDVKNTGTSEVNPINELVQERS
jgi:hypothetical protein